MGIRIRRKRSASCAGLIHCEHTPLKWQRRMPFSNVVKTNLIPRAFFPSIVISWSNVCCRLIHKSPIWTLQWRGRPVTPNNIEVALIFKEGEFAMDMSKESFLVDMCCTEARRKLVSLNRAQVLFLQYCMRMKKIQCQPQAIRTTFLLNALSLQKQQDVFLSLQNSSSHQSFLLNGLMTCKDRVQLVWKVGSH